MNKYLCFILLSIVVALNLNADRLEADSVNAEDTRPIIQIYSLEVGEHFAKATYLSPCRYHGSDWSVAGRWGKRLSFAPNRARMDFDFRASLWPQLVNPAGYVAMQGFELDGSWQMSAFFNIHNLFNIAVGGGPELSGGVLILMRNSNNPVAVDLSASLAAGVSIWRNFKIGRLPVTAEWRLRSPLVGAFFMPQFGETFYEIYLGNRAGLAHASWPGNHFRINSLASLRLNFGKTAMEVGYRFITDSRHANNLTDSQFTHAVSIGIIPHGLRY